MDRNNKKSIRNLWERECDVSSETWNQHHVCCINELAQIWVTGAILIPVINQCWINSNHDLADNIVATREKLKKSLQNHENESI